MNFILICIVEAIVIVLLMYRACINKKTNTKIRHDLIATIMQNNETISFKNMQLEEDEKSIMNAENMMGYIKRLSNKKDLWCHARNMNVYKKTIESGGLKQNIYALFYEYDMIYTMDYIDNKYEEFDVNKHVEHLRLECRIFFDNETIDPALLNRINVKGKECYIEELNIKHYEGKGIGSFYLESLSKELLRYENINVIRGGLSPVDYKNKEQLTHFYIKNGFDVEPMEKDKWGAIEKKIR